MDIHQFLIIEKEELALVLDGIEYHLEFGVVEIEGEFGTLRVRIVGVGLKDGCQEKKNYYPHNQKGFLQRMVGPPVDGFTIFHRFAMI
jgi:hypothetical protein